jgi:hypothetical protein
MRCLYCGKQLALLKRLTGSGEFCSEAHKQSYHEEYNRLALTRLLQAQSRADDAKQSFIKPGQPSEPSPDRGPAPGHRPALASASARPQIAAPATKAPPVERVEKPVETPQVAAKAVEDVPIRPVPPLPLEVRQTPPVAPEVPQPPAPPPAGFVLDRPAGQGVQIPELVATEELPADAVVAPALPDLAIQSSEREPDVEPAVKSNHAIGARELRLQARALDPQLAETREQGPQLAFQLTPRPLGGLTPCPVQPILASHTLPLAGEPAQWQNHIRFSEIGALPELGVLDLLPADQDCFSAKPPQASSDPDAPELFTDFLWTGVRTITPRQPNVDNGIESVASFSTNLRLPQANGTPIRLKPEVSSRPAFVVANGDSKRPAAVRVKVAALAAAIPDDRRPMNESALPSQILKTLSKSGAAAALQTPALPAPVTRLLPAPESSEPAPRRRGSKSGLPSILDSSGSAPEEGRSLWSTLRKYMKR